MSRNVLLLVLLSLVIAASAATAQTMSLAVLEDGEYTRSFDVVTEEAFTVVTLLDTDGHEAALATVFSGSISSRPIVICLGTLMTATSLTI